MDRGRAKGRVSVRRNLFRLAAAGNVAAAIFLAKNLLGYKDFVTNEHSGPGGAPSRSTRDPTSPNSPMKNSSSFGSLLARPSFLTRLTRSWPPAVSGSSSGRLGRSSSPQRLSFPAGTSTPSSSTSRRSRRGQIRNLLINVPPRHMKSLLVSVFWPAWEWIRWPERRWLYSSYAAHAEHSRFGEVPASDRVALVSGALG